RGPTGSQSGMREVDIHTIDGAMGGDKVDKAARYGEVDLGAEQAETAGQGGQGGIGEADDLQMARAVRDVGQGAGAVEGDGIGGAGGVISALEGGGSRVGEGDDPDAGAAQGHDGAGAGAVEGDAHVAGTTGGDGGGGGQLAQDSGSGGHGEVEHPEVSQARLGPTADHRAGATDGDAVAEEWDIGGADDEGGGRGCNDGHGEAEGVGGQIGAATGDHDGPGIADAGDEADEGGAEGSRELRRGA